MCHSRRHAYQEICSLQRVSAPLSAEQHIHHVAMAAFFKQTPCQCQNSAHILSFLPVLSMKSSPFPNNDSRNEILRTINR